MTFLPAALGAIVALNSRAFWLVFVVALLPFSFVVLFFDPAGKSDIIRAAAYYAGAAISTVVGWCGGKYMRSAKYNSKER
ncbi:hypothetical protein HGE74_09480 [Rhodobacteraceae bacterium R_SAG1]|nr:hypothetical protein [Rhodobacteraceae bacterium R_SAG1]